MHITKAIITAAGLAQAHLPLQSVVTRSGDVYTALGTLLQDISQAGINDVAVVIRPGAADQYRQAAGGMADRLSFYEQTNPLGYGDALLRAREFVGAEPFLHLVSDHLYVSQTNRSCAAQLIEIANREKCAISAVQPTRENYLSYFGAIGGTPVPMKPGLYQVSEVLEKPTPTIAEQRLIVAGQRAGYYLCLFGMHVLTPRIFELLEQQVNQFPSAHGVNLSGALNQLARNERYLASELNGNRYNIGEKYGLLIAQLAIALSGEDRDRVLTELLQLVAENQMRERS
ncbi:MAG: UTP--glucose-1-phosphate uridylyltransferase [Pirellulaceae bacterium]|nr:UTP--glucose-1-phosphate uridylyltransferase [Pirellulaceae bacterium]